jgi:signal transduction histidine kinase
VRTWWLGDATGALVVLPLALAWSAPPSRAWWRRHALETGLVLVAVAGVSEVALHYSEPFAYLVFPPLIVAALRLGPRGATLAVAVAAGYAIWETTRQVGPFAYQSSTQSTLATQLYLAVAALSTLLLAAVVCERAAFAASLAASRARIVGAADAERRRIEQNLHDGAQQRLSALLIRLRLGAELVADAPETAVGRLESAAHELSEAIEELRDLAHGIHPSALTRDGLAPALAQLAARSALPVRLELSSAHLDATVEVTAYFVVAEAITNAHKHAHATSLAVRTTESRGRLSVVITDDGRGGADESAGSGLQGLRDRVEAIGGAFAVRSGAGGTRIMAVVPATAGPRAQAP